MADDSKPNELLLTNRNGELIEKAVKEGYSLEPFMDTFMHSETAKLMDSPDGYNRYSSGELSLLWNDFLDECRSHGQQLVRVDSFEKSVPAYMCEVGFWSGYAYRCWHFAKGLSSREMADLIPALYMICEYQWGHTISVDDWVENCTPRVIALMKEEKETASSEPNE